MEKVVVHVTQNVRRSMLYVACSRATSSSGLFIVTKESEFRPPSAPSENCPVVIEMIRLESTCPFILFSSFEKCAYKYNSNYLP